MFAAVSKNKYNMVNKFSKWLSASVAAMGFVHIAATFSPVIAGKLLPLPESVQQAFIYMSLMCGVMLVVCGTVAFLLSSKVKEFEFLRKPYFVVLIALLIDGILAAYCMPHNPCAWIILILALLLIVINVMSSRIR